MTTTRRLRHIFCLAIAGGIALVGAAPAKAQLPQARLFSIFPCGGKAGSTVELSLTTVADLDEADHLLFNHAGITAVPKTTDVGGKKNRSPTSLKSPSVRTFPRVFTKSTPAACLGFPIRGSSSSARRTNQTNPSQTTTRRKPTR